LETRRWNGTKSAFADYASAVAPAAAGGACRHRALAIHANAAAESAKADFVPL